MLMFHRFKLVAATVIAVSALALGGPAQAAGVQGPVTGSGNYTGVILNGLTVVYECNVEAPGAVSVAITRCKLTSSTTNSTIALPGSAAANAGTVNVPFEPFQLCWTARATYVDASTKSTTGCTSTTTGSGADLVGAGYSVNP
jgi:hypothetical protein